MCGNGVKIYGYVELENGPKFLVWAIPQTILECLEANSVRNSRENR